MDEQSFTDFDDTLEVDLYEEENPPENESQGGLKSYSVKSDGEVIYEAGRESDFSITVERLLCVDGWEDAKATPPQAMTLLVLKFVLDCTDPDGRFESMTATMEFEDGKDSKQKAKPEVESWAPFLHMQRYNESDGDKIHKVNMGGELGGSAAGGTATVKAGVENEISWKQKYFDEGHATPVLSKIDGRRNGIKWFLKQNEIQNAGVASEFRVAVLLKRASPAPFVCKFQVRVRAGMTNDFVNGIKRFFGANPGRTKPFLVKPLEAARARYEGKEMLKNVEAKYLGKLKKGGQLLELSIVWGYEATS